MPFINDVIDANIESIQEKKESTTQKFVSNYRFNVEQCIEHLNTNIIGQKTAIDAIEDILYRVKADMRAPNKPLSVCLLFGPTGVGKTQVIHSLAQSLLGDASALCRIDMNTLSQAHYSAALSGAPPGYAGSKEHHTLFNIEAITGSYSKPGIVLFDEIEKASNEVLRSLLAVLDHGSMTLSNGEKTIDFTNSLIFMTSNLGSQSILKRNLITRIQKAIQEPFQSKAQKQKQSKALQEIAAYFDPEFFNRIEQFIEFHPLDAPQLDQLMSLEVLKLNRRVQKHGLVVSFSEATKEHLRKHYNRSYGARNLHHIVRSQIDSIIAKALIRGLESKTIEIGYSMGEYVLVEP